MSLIHEIQAALMKDESHIGHILLKMRFLAAQLGSDVLADWVKHELEGYPRDVTVPDYRRLSISYRGTFYGPFGSGIQNAPLPSYLIEKFAGPKWTTHEERQSISSLYEMYQINKKKMEGSFHIDATNLILLLQGKIYEDLACNSVVGDVSSSQVFNIIFVVRSRLLDLTLELQKKVPEISKIKINHSIDMSKQMPRNVTNIVNQVIGGNYQGSTAIGDGNSPNVVVVRGDVNSLVQELVSKGIPDEDAKEFAKIVEEDGVEEEGEPLSRRAQLWFADKAKQIASGVWGVSLSVATDILKQSAKQYLGLS